MIPNPRLRTGILAVVSASLYQEYRTRQGNPGAERWLARDLQIHEGTERPVTFVCGDEPFGAYYDPDQRQVVIGAWDADTDTLDPSDLTAQALTSAAQHNGQEMLRMLQQYAQ
jgi:hypothetical protein